MTQRSYAELADIFEGMAAARANWLRDHGRKFGEMARLQKQREMEACAQVAEWLRRAAKRDVAA